MFHRIFCLKRFCHAWKAHQTFGSQQTPTDSFVTCGGAVEGDVKSPEESGNIMDAYRQLWEVIKLPAVKRFAIVLLTFR